jgi:hypothetical protein
VADDVISDTAPFAVYTVPWHNANATAMNDRNYVYLCGDDFAGNSLANLYTLRTCTTVATNYPVQVMGSPAYVGAVHQVLDATMLDLDVSADFLRDAVAVGGAIVRCVIVD